MAGGGIHFSDEIFKNKKDLVQVYLGVIQNRNIEIDGYKWPIDTLIVDAALTDDQRRLLDQTDVRVLIAGPGEEKQP